MLLSQLLRPWPLLLSSPGRALPQVGEVAVSYFEMVQNSCVSCWDEEEVHERLDRKMAAAYHSLLSASKEYNMNMPQAADVRAVKCVVEATKLRDWCGSSLKCMEI